MQGIGIVGPQLTRSHLMRSFLTLVYICAIGPDDSATRSFPVGRDGQKSTGIRKGRIVSLGVLRLETGAVDGKLRTKSFVMDMYMREPPFAALRSLMAGPLRLSPKKVIL